METITTKLKFQNQIAIHQLFEEGDKYIAATLSERFKFQNIEGWAKISRREFCDRFREENWELMWQWPNDQ
jgi:hypothetical protein